MKKINSINTPSGKTVELKPIGYHIMLIGLKKPISLRNRINLTLEFEKFGIVKVEALVKEKANHSMHH